MPAVVPSMAIHFSGEGTSEEDLCLDEFVSKSPVEGLGSSSMRARPEPHFGIFLLPRPGLCGRHQKATDTSAAMCRRHPKTAYHGQTFPLQERHPTRAPIPIPSLLPSRRRQRGLPLHVIRNLGAPRSTALAEWWLRVATLIAERGNSVPVLAFHRSNYGVRYVHHHVRSSSTSC